MDLSTIFDQVSDLLRQRQRVTYRALQVHCQLEDETRAALTDARLYAHPEVHDDAGRGLVWTGGLDTPPSLPHPRRPSVHPIGLAGTPSCPGDNHPRRRGTAPAHGTLL